jgi:Radical SAM superfamily/4Fe-4S single cluster domain/Iron-sulfur cluster-binding domain
MTEAFKEHDKSINSERDLTGRFCERPFELMEIHREFYAFACCPSWLPTIIGNCETSNLMEVWNSQKAQAVRTGILDGSFRHCDHRECPRIQAGTLPKVSELSPRHRNIYEAGQVVLKHLPSQIALCYDDSCNLSCPSCRTQRIMDVAGQGFERKIRFTDQLMAQLLDHVRNQVVWLRVTGSGDPIGSKVFRHLLTRLDGHSLPNLKIVLQTNAVMLTPKVWHEMHGIHGNLHSISISIDAASEATYAKTRRLGNWQQLMENIRFIIDLARNGMIKRIDCNFVVQTENYREMGDFVSLCTGFGSVDKIFFSLVNDWGTWSRAEYAHQCIWKTDHPEFDNFLATLRDPRLAYPSVDLGNLTAYRARALEDRPRQTVQDPPSNYVPL